MISSRATLRRGLLERTGSVALSGGKGHRLAESVSGDCVSRQYSGRWGKAGTGPRFGRLWLGKDR